MVQYKTQTRSSPPVMCRSEPLGSSVCLCTFTQPHSCDKRALMLSCLKRPVSERRQTFVFGLRFFLFGDLISAEIETPTWPAATGEMNGKVHCIPTPHMYHSIYCVYHFHWLTPALVFILNKRGLWNTKWGSLLYVSIFSFLISSFKYNSFRCCLRFKVLYT